GALVRLGFVVGLAALILAVAAGVQLARDVPPARASVDVPVGLALPGRPAPLPWPTKGAAALEIEGVAYLGGVNTEEVRPLASVTKLITALVLLKHHPLALGQQGPTFTITAAEAATYAPDVAQNQSVVRVVAGEQLTELQGLEAMLIPSADNVARFMAVWDAGSLSAFIADMNSEAASLGLRHTHLTDPSGLDAGSVGTASDMLRLAEAVMSQPVLRRIVAMPQVTLPVAGTVYNYDSVLGHDGIIGIKTGSTVPAGGNFVFAATRHWHGRALTIIGAVLGAAGAQPLASALSTSEQLSAAALSDITQAPVLGPGKTMVRVSTAWGSTTSAKTAGSASFTAVPGTKVQVRFQRLAPLSQGDFSSWYPGERVGVLHLSAGLQSASVPVIATGRLSGAPLSWRLSRF
ncbi:MAG TPA: serine hydrolase, partial [Acidimicrobiales bacterium]|nr:serine hydrolase [Acidimicrobiales bacterium]